MIFEMKKKTIDKKLPKSLSSVGNNIPNNIILWILCNIFTYRFTYNAIMIFAKNNEFVMTFFKLHALDNFVSALSHL